MRPSGSARSIIVGSMLAICMSLALPHFAFGAARSFGKAAGIQRSFGAAHSSGSARRDRGSHRQPFSRGFGFVGGVGGFSEQPVVIIQVQPAPITVPAEAPGNRIYVKPRWVDGGHGVQVLEPGYWTDPKRATER